MAEAKKEYKTVILNGTKVWLTACMFLVVHGGAFVWQFATLNANVKTLSAQVTKNTEMMEDRYTGEQAKHDKAEIKGELAATIGIVSKHVSDPDLHYHLNYRLQQLEKEVENAKHISTNA